MSQIKAQVTGDLELAAILRDLAPKMQRRTLRAGVAAGARTIARAAKSAAPVGATGALKRAMASKVKTYKNGNVAGIIGARKGLKVDKRGVKAAGRQVAASRYLHLVEKGTAAHAIRRGDSHGMIQHPGAKANPFLEQAAQAALPAAGAKIAEKCKDFLEREAAKMGRH